MRFDQIAVVIPLPPAKARAAWVKRQSGAEHKVDLLRRKRHSLRLTNAVFAFFQLRQALEADRVHFPVPAASGQQHGLALRKRLFDQSVQADLAADGRIQQHVFRCDILRHSDDFTADGGAAGLPVGNLLPQPLHLLAQRALLLTAAHKRVERGRKCPS